jgi:hypothetical protein
MRSTSFLTFFINYFTFIDPDVDTATISWFLSASPWCWWWVLHSGGWKWSFSRVEGLVVKITITKIEYDKEVSSKSSWFCRSVNKMEERWIEAQKFQIEWGGYKNVGAPLTLFCKECITGRYCTLHSSVFRVKCKQHKDGDKYKPKTYLIFYPIVSVNTLSNKQKQ